MELKRVSEKRDDEFRIAACLAVRVRVRVRVRVVDMLQNS